MTINGEGTPSEDEVPQNEEGLNAKPINNFNAFGNTCKPLGKTFFNRYDRKGLETQIQTYLDLGLTPIPLKGKIPRVKWRHGWNPKTIEDLGWHVGKTVNWGLKTGGSFAAIDFDNTEAFTDFIVANIDNLPSDAPIVRTGRGYHLWFRPAQPVKDMHFQGIDIKGVGGQIVAPPSVHPTTGRRYKFIRPPKGDIPVIDIDELVFPNLKKPETNHSRSVKSTQSVKGMRTDKPRFSYDDIKDGVDEGGRTTALVRYIGHLIWRRLSKDEILTLVTEWNKNNRPPMIKEIVKSTVNDCYARYAPEYSDTCQDDAYTCLDTAANTPVPTKTLAKSNSVLNGTKPYPRISRLQPLYTPDSPTPDPWETETETRYTVADCGKRRAIMRRGREYMSVSFFCGKWECPRCGPYFKNRWTEHMVEITKDSNLYVTEIDEHDWGCIRKQINRLKADYMKIKTTGGVFKIITDKPLDGSNELPQESLKAYLESSIPNTTSKCPISTSRAWQHHKKEKTSDEYEAVAITWLPVKEQVEVAEELGARRTKRTRWLSPEDIDEEEWAEDFKEAIKERERAISQFLGRSATRLDWQWYLNKEYMEDAVNDELEKDNDIFDDIMVAVC
ncbi:bifunctional DNA primase/polymerase [Chloroflexota bacterium]